MPSKYAPVKANCGIRREAAHSRPGRIRIFAGPRPENRLQLLSDVTEVDSGKTQSSGGKEMCQKSGEGVRNSTPIWPLLGDAWLRFTTWQTRSSLVARLVRRSF